MTTLQVLKKARALVRKGWCQGFFAKTRNGRKVMPDHPRAIKWCVSGAIGRAGGEYLAYQKFKRAIGEKSISDWNDRHGRSQAQVLAAFDRAIKAVSK